MQLIVAQVVADAVQQRVAELGLPVEIVVAGDDGQMTGEVHDAAAYFRAFMSGAGYARVLATAPQLRWIHTASAGVDGLLTDDLRQRGITLTNSAGVHAIPIAEWVLHALLMIVKRGRELIAAQAEQRWSDESFDELGGKTLLVYGAGGIGAEIARRAAAFDMQLWGVNRSGRAVPHFDRVVRDAEWRSLLPQADYLVLAAPYTPATHHVIAAETLRQLPAHAWLINVARGGLVDEPDLIEALTAGTLAGAALDTFEQEPLPRTSPLWMFPNVLISPHRSGSSPRSNDRVVDCFIANLQRFVAGDELHNIVDQEAGY